MTCQVSLISSIRRNRHSRPDYQDKESFLNTSKWIDDVRAERGNEAIVVLVGNKTDLNEKRLIFLKERKSGLVYSCTHYNRCCIEK